MKLYLSSFGLGNRPEQLVNLTGAGKNAVVIMNALDHDKEARQRWLPNEIEALNKLGYITEELDLRKYFKQPFELQKYLSSKDLVWVNGGNTFVLRSAMRQSGFDEIITKRLKEDSIVYSGFSAGCVVLHKDLHGLEITDDPTLIPEGYESEIIWEGLGLINFNIAVHYQSDHPESELTEKEIVYYQTNNIPYKTLKDGQIIVINGEQIQILD